MSLRAAEACDPRAGRLFCWGAGARLDGVNHGRFARRGAESCGIETSRADVFYVA
jgi:hypothetical protein